MCPKLASSTVPNRRNVSLFENFKKVLNHFTLKKSVLSKKKGSKISCNCSFRSCWCFQLKLQYLYTVHTRRSGPKFLTTGNEMAEKIIIFIGIIINSVPLIAILKYFDYGLLFAEIDNMESKIYFFTTFFTNKLF